MRIHIYPEQLTSKILRQFYKLSKSHHPDLHPNDPAKSKRFVAISEAYSILGSPDKRQRYDRDFLQSSSPSGGGGGPGHRGSYSSHSTPAGGRPASGLSKRRTQFKGPPPSFYRSGGWGAHSEKRSQYASSGPEATYDHPSSAAGTGPGGFAQGADHDVPHFDQQEHFTRHENLERTRHQARKTVKRSATSTDDTGGTSPLGGFVLVSTILAGIYGISVIVAGGDPRAGGKKKKEGDDA